jgi:transglutaminase-like putative cysteine protease
MIQMDYQLELQYQAQNKSDFVLNICPARTRSQRVLNESFAVEGATPTYTFTEPSTANRINRLYSEGGLVTIRYRSTVEIDHVHVDPATVDERVMRSMPSEVLQYVLPSRYCQSDKMRDIALAMFGNVAPGYQRAVLICDWVTQHVRFKPGASNATTCAMETFNSRAGVCRDYAHLMIVICRALNIPARYVTSVDYGADPSLGPADFHACVEVFMGYRWYLFDPSGLSNVLGLIRIGTGRDAADASIATVFGSVQCMRPKVSIDRLSKHEVEVGAMMPTRHAISTAAESMAFIPMSPKLETQSSLQVRQQELEAIPGYMIGQAAPNSAHASQAA